MESFKRRAPKVDPVVFGGVRYEVTRGPRTKGFEQNSGVVSAIEESSDKELWTIAVYPVAYDDGEEDDAEDIFITALEIEGGVLLVTDESGRRFAVQLTDGSVAELPAK